MPLKTALWDSAEYLRTEEERAGYLAACIEEAPDDPAVFAHALGVVARSRNMSRLAGVAAPGPRRHGEPG